jgi:RNA polymerase sigma-70 factor (ECF subfamily)
MKSAEKRRLLETHYLDFFSLAIAMLREVDDAKDAVQEAMVRVLTTRKIDDVMSYTYQCVRNAAIDIYRHRKRTIPLGDNVPDVTDEHETRLRQVAELRDELPEALKALVELHDEEDYTYAELSALTNIPVMTIRRRLDEAHALLKKRIEEEI